MKLSAQATGIPDESVRVLTKPAPVRSKLMDSSAQNATNDSQMGDHMGSVGRFFVLNKKGQLFALRKLEISHDCRKVAPLVSSIDLGPISPLIEKVKASKMSLVLHPASPAKFSFEMTVKMGPTKRSVKLFENPVKIVSGAIQNETLPVVLYDEIAKSVAESAAGQPQIKVPIRHLLLKQSTPDPWSDATKELFLINAHGKDNRLNELETQVRKFRVESRKTMLTEFLMKCIWLNTEDGQVGTLEYENGRIGFRTFDGSDSEFNSFVCTLSKDEYGRFFAAHTEVGNVLVELDREHPWVSPTVHIYREAFRVNHQLNEYYSLYNGIRELSKIGAPVLLYEGKNPFQHPIPLRFLQIAERAAGLLGGDMFSMSAREFTGRDIVWSDPI